MTNHNIRQPPAGQTKQPRMTAVTPVAILFTVVSFCWTGWSITDLVQSGAWGILAAVSVDGLWGVVQYLSYKRVGGRFIEVVEWVTLFIACALLAWHGWGITPAAAFAGALPPIVAKIAWVGDIRLRFRRTFDPTAPTPEQQAHLEEVMRDSGYEARLKAAEIERDSAVEIAEIRAQGKVDMERLQVGFEVDLKEIETRAALKRRTPPTLGDGTEAESGSAIDFLGEQVASMRDAFGDFVRDLASELRPNQQLNTPSRVREPLPSVADLARDFVAKMSDNKHVTEAIMQVRPDANRDSVAAAVRKARKAVDGPYL